MRTHNDPGRRRAALTASQHVAKHLIAPGLAGLRRVRPLRFARGVIHADALLMNQRSDPTLQAVFFDLSEPARELIALGVGDAPPATKPITTSVTMIDGCDGALSFRNNHVVDRGGRIVFERSTSEYGKPYAFRDLRAWRFPLDAPRPVPGTVAYLSNMGVHNIGHWLLFVYPLVEFYRDYLGSEPDYYYVGEPLQEFHFASLSELGIGRERVLRSAAIGDRMLAAMADHHVPTPTRFLDFSTTSLRLERDPTQPRRRIHISRSMTRTRHLLNEAECESVLLAHGFETFTTENLSLREERELFASAEIVLAVHGAGLANLLFCHPRTVVVELFPAGYRDPWFTEVSAARGLSYACLTGEEVDVRGLRPTHYPVLVDVEKLESVLKAAVESASEGSEPCAASNPTPSDGG